MNQEELSDPELSSGAVREMVQIRGTLPDAFERRVLHYHGNHRYLATWWSEDRQSVVRADGRSWRAAGVDENEWIWWTHTLAVTNRFDADFLGYDLNLPLRVLLLDLRHRRIWLAPIGAACDFLRSVASLKETESA